MTTKRFESDVISDGTQTLQFSIFPKYRFESDVISDGTQTIPPMMLQPCWFESDVISDGTQTLQRSDAARGSLRVM